MRAPELAFLELFLIGKDKLGFELKQLFPNAICCILPFSKLFLLQVITLLYYLLALVCLLFCGDRDRI